MRLNVAQCILLVWTTLVYAQETPIPTIDDMSPEVKVRLQEFRDTDWSRRLQIAGETATHNRFLQANDCTSTSQDYVIDKIAEMGIVSYQIIIDWNLGFLAYIYKQLLDDSKDREYFGPHGESTVQLQKMKRKLEKFWGKSNKAGSQEIITTDIKLLGAHGIDLADKSKLVRTLELVYPSLDSTFHHTYARLIQSFIETLPGNYTNPILTFSAYTIADSRGTADVIVYGEGISDFFNVIGIPEGPSFTLAHEFGHQLQLNLNTLMDLNGDSVFDPSEARRIELMCDAFAGYFLHHKKGAGFTTTKIDDLADAAYSFGDCEVNSPDHHGTPNQRKCATKWGASQAKNVILYPKTFMQRFDRHLSRILEVDVSICK